MSRRIALLNNKGGVGKTFAAVALAEAAGSGRHPRPGPGLDPSGAALAQAAALTPGARVLCVDMDPQANLTRRLGVRPEPYATLTSCLNTTVAQEGAAQPYIQPAGWGGPTRIDVLAADLDLEDRALEAGLPGAHNRLKRVLYGADEGYDLTIIDCPPSIKGHLTVMAIAALDGDLDTVLVPLALEYDAIGGARRAVEYVRMWRADLGVPRLEVSGLIVNSVRQGTSLHQVRMTQLDELLSGFPVLATVPLRARIAEIQDAGLPLSSDPGMAGILAEFTDLADLLLRKDVSTDGR